MFRRTLLALPAVLILVLGACDASESVGPSNGNDPVRPPPALSAQLVLENRSSYVITDVRYSPCSDDYYGPNRLVGIIAAGASATFFVEGIGCYDILALAGSRVRWETRTTLQAGTNSLRLN